MTKDDLIKFILQMIAYGGGSAAIAYLLFQWLGKKWIENKFAQRLEELRHQQALELQRLRVKIDSMLSGAIKLQEKEFTILPEAWAILDEAHHLVGWLLSPFQQYAPVSDMNNERLEEFLGGTDFLESEKNEIRKAGDKDQIYQEILFWHRLHKVKTAFGELQAFVARNGIFLPSELEGKFTKISKALWSATTSKEIGHEAKDFKMQREGWTQIKEETEPLYEEIKREIQARLQSHANKE